MAGFESILSEDAAVRKRRIRMVVSIIIGVVLLHVAAGVVAGIFIVARYIFPPPANFVVKKDIRLPAKKREHKMNMAALDAIAPKPTLSDKMQSTRPTAFSLPDVPDMPLDQMLPLDPSQLLADQMASFSNSEALGAISGAGAAGGGGFGGKGIGFLGVNASGKRILLMIDVSQTVPRNCAALGYPFEKIKEEAEKLIKGLPVTARFGLGEFNEFNFSPFRETLVPNGSTNRNLATPWLASKLLGGNAVPGSRWGGGIIGVLNYAQEVKPELVYILSDGDYRTSFADIKIAVENVKDETGAATQIKFIFAGPKGYKLQEMEASQMPKNVSLIILSAGS